MRYFNDLYFILLGQNKRQNATASTMLQAFSIHPVRPFLSPVLSSIVFLLTDARL